MPRATPDWNWEPSLPSDYGVDFSPSLVSKIREITHFADAEAQDRFLALALLRVQEFFYFSEEKQKMASKDKVIAAAKRIEKEAGSLASKLPYCGGAQHYFSYALTELEIVEDRFVDDSMDYLKDVRAMLKELQEVASMAARDAGRDGAESDNSQWDVRKWFAKGIADAYRKAFHLEPRASVQRDYGKAHPYVLLLHALYEYATQRQTPLTTIEHVARKAFED